MMIRPNTAAGRLLPNSEAFLYSLKIQAFQEALKHSSIETPLRSLME